MFQGWRLQLREAEEAFEQGRLEESGRLVFKADLQKYLPGRRLADRVANRLADRARRNALNGEFSAGWRDLDHARSIGGDSRRNLETRQELIELVLSEVEGHLCSGDTSRALALVEETERQRVSCDALRIARDVARHLESARNLGLRGKFRDADAQLETALSLRPDLDLIHQRRAQCAQLRERSHEVQQRLHRALAENCWSDALAEADRLLELAPKNRLAQDARKRAWSEVGAQVSDSHWTGELSAWSNCTSDATAVCEASGAQALGAQASGGENTRFLLWVDAVGGFLVSLSDEVVLGQAVPGGSVDIPIQADISRRHATIRRCGDGYTIEPWSDVRVAGKSISERTLLSDGDEIELGGSVRLRFRQPHALSASARLEFVSRHRTQPLADGVLLMAESCVLGPNWQNHVVCRDWTDDVVLFRQGEDLYCRSMEAIEIDGKLCDGKGKVTRNARIAGENFAMSLEAV